MTTRAPDSSTTIVVGFDFSDPAHLALDAAFAWAAMHSTADIHAIAVLDETKRDATYQQADAFRDEVAAVLTTMVETHPAPGITAYPHARIGAPAECILNLAGEVRADLICVGSHGVTGLPRLVLGSVSETVLRGADCPVLAMRPTSYPAQTEPELSPEPPCPECVKAQLADDDADARCEVHAGSATTRSRYEYRKVARQQPIRHAAPAPNAPFGPRPSVVDDNGPHN